MITYETISKDTLKKVTTTEEIIDLKALKKELASLEIEKTALEKEPDEIMMPNDSKIFRQGVVDERIKEIQSLLKV